MNTLEVVLKMPAEAAKVCCRSVGIETKSEALSRSSIELSSRGDRLTLLIKAQDLSAMRAALNTYLRWISMCAGLTEKPQK